MIASSSSCWNSKLIPLHLIPFFPPTRHYTLIYAQEFLNGNFRSSPCSPTPLNKFYEPCRDSSHRKHAEDNKLNRPLVNVQLHTWIALLLRVVVWQSSHREIKKLYRKRKRKNGGLTRPDFHQLYRELLAVDDFFDNFPKKTPIARALIYSIKVGGGGRRAFVVSKPDS